MNFTAGIEDLLNLVIQFDENIKTSFTLQKIFNLFELIGKENLRFILGSEEICFRIL